MHQENCNVESAIHKKLLRLNYMLLPDSVNRKEAGRELAHVGYNLCLLPVFWEIMLGIATTIATMCLYMS